MLEMFKALADPTRLRLLAILQDGEFTVQELIDILDMGQSRISRHLKILLDVGLVQVKREGTWGYYRLDLSNATFADLQRMLKDKSPELPQYGRDRAATAAVLNKRRRRNQEFFEVHAEQWDRMSSDLLPTPDMQSMILQPLTGFECLLEIGIGTGGLLEALHAQSRRLIGVDHSPAMLAAARERVKSLGLDGVELRLGEMEHLPLAEDSVDGVVLNMVLHHASDPTVVLREVARVLRPNGVLIICDLSRHEEEWVREELADQWLGFSPEELTGWCAETGFTDTEIDQVNGSGEEHAVLLLRARKNND